MVFSQHGLVKVQRRNGLLEVTLKGSFNWEASIEYKTIVTSFLNEMRGKSCSILLDTTDLEGAIPDAWNTVAELNDEIANNSNLKLFIVVCNNALIKHCLEKVNKPTLKSKIRLFNNRASAICLLSS